MCENIGAGDHTVRIRTTQCVYTKTEPANYYTGWKSYSRMHIEEVRQSARLDAGRFKDNDYIFWCTLFSSRPRAKILKIRIEQNNDHL